MKATYRHRDGRNVTVSYRREGKTRVGAFMFDIGFGVQFSPEKAEVLNRLAAAANGLLLADYQTTGRTAAGADFTECAGFQFFDLLHEDRETVFYAIHALLSNDDPEPAEDYILQFETVLLANAADEGGHDWGQYWFEAIGLNEVQPA